ncbi:MAG TPA: ATP-binding cassette domain-containing protein [Limnobacter sp.]|nr:ATP-binding cassette domain-containing protein [Limnobacter sp.]
MICLGSHGLDINIAPLSAAGVLLAPHIACTLPLGQVHLVHGDNGVGKSTLLRKVSLALGAQAQLYKPEHGLRDELLLIQHAAQILAMHRVPTQRGHALLEQLGLGDWAHERIGTLSSGQRARLGLLHWCVQPAPVWLLDEPLNNLDANGRMLLLGMIQHHLDQGGVVLMATHLDWPELHTRCGSNRIATLRLQQGQLQADAFASHLNPQRTPHTQQSVCFDVPRAAPWSALFMRQLAVWWAQPQQVLWGALFHWMVLAFFGMGLNKPDPQVVFVAVWVSFLLALMLNAKDWFADDVRVRWLAELQAFEPRTLGRYWLATVAIQAALHMVVMLPVTGLAALQFGLGASQAMALCVALLLAVWAVAPLLGMLSVLVLLTRGGAVLVYLLALPLVVPALLFGLEATRASLLGRSPEAPLLVLFALGALLYLIGPVVARRLFELIQE